MITNQSFSDALYADQERVAERELAAFIQAVTQLYGSEEAKIAGREWLDESEVMDSPPLSASRDWRAVTVAASARLAERIGATASPASKSFDQ